MTKTVCSFSAILFLLVFFTSLQHLSAQSTTPSGLVYTIFPGSGGEKAKAGDFVKFNLKYTIGDKDTVLQSTFGKIPEYSAVDTGKDSEFSFMEIIPKLSAGDSAEIMISVDSLKNRNIIADYDLIFTKGSNLKCRLRLMQIFKLESDVDSDYRKELEREKSREIKDIEIYIKGKGIKAVQKTKNGAYVLVENPGDITLKADSGKVATIKYKGYFFDGTVFDTNMDSSTGSAEPIEVPVGNGKVMQGWDEALPYFGKGGKGKIFIPAMLAYGPQGSAPVIPPYSNLIFDIQILDVKDESPSDSDQ
ncbi:MAG TPA: FKBP-type peptidyl-prolyl cis-trans isomerase [Parafilimonas sp.]|nr:FKBP-type peptidyl-prolyl cis-trans isomerase [Parafilimonas sp.]